MAGPFRLVGIPWVRDPVSLREAERPVQRESATSSCSAIAWDPAAPGDLSAARTAHDLDDELERDVAAAETHALRGYVLRPLWTSAESSIVNVVTGVKCGVPAPT